MQENILEELPSTFSTVSTKLHFLQRQKEEMAQLIGELNSSIRLNKETISKMALLTESTLNEEERQTTIKEVVTELNSENNQLRGRNELLMEEVESVQCQLLLQNQVREEGEIEFMLIMKQYEEKILELRRSIQDKEFLLQDKESTEKHDLKKPPTFTEPKVDLMKAHAEYEDVRELLRKVTTENNTLRQENEQLRTKNTQDGNKLRRLECLMASNVSYRVAKEMYREEKRNKSQSKVCVSEPSSLQENRAPQLDVPKTKDTHNKGFANYSTVDGGYHHNQTLASLRGILLKYSESFNTLKKEFKLLQQDHTQLVSSNKLLRESNIQHQIQRARIQQETNFLKNKNRQLLSLISQRRVKRSNSNDCNKVQTIIKDTDTTIVLMENRKETKMYLQRLKVELAQQTANLDCNINRNYLTCTHSTRSKGRSFSCYTDYVMKAEVDAVEKYLNKRPTKGHQESRVESTPFTLDYSVIESKSAPLTFADFRKKVKSSNKFTESFMMITEEILKA